MRLVLEVSGDPAPVTETIDVLRKRVTEVGDRYTTVEPLETNRIEVLAPGLSDSQAISNYLTRPGVMTFNLVDMEADPSSYPMREARGGRVALPDGSLDGEPLVIYSDAILTGADVSEASGVVDDLNLPAIAVKLKPAGAQRLEKATSANVGRAIAVVLDGQILSSPTIMTPITGGDFQITGNFMTPETNQIAAILRSGVLPARVTVIESSTFGEAPP